MPAQLGERRRALQRQRERVFPFFLVSSLSRCISFAAVVSGEGDLDGGKG